MSETFFPIHDLLRRKLQTSLVIVSLTLCVASTLFLLLFSERIGVGISLTAENTLTVAFSSVFSSFVIFLEILIFIAGIVMLSFTVFVMMSQRVRDIGLMKATGCPNDLIFGYFINELLIVTFVGCFLGVVVGIIADLVAANFFSNPGFQVSQKPINFWLVLVVFVAFFIIALIVGANPILKTTKIAPVKAISPTYYIGLSKEAGFRVKSHTGFTTKIAWRSLSRRKSATIRVVLCLSVVFTLITVAVAGGIIADQTTKSWVEKAIGKDIVLIAHQNMTNQYKLLLSKFYEAETDSAFNYTDEKYMIPNSLLTQLQSLQENVSIDARLVLKGSVQEVKGISYGESTEETQYVGDSRSGESLIVGIEPRKVLNDWDVNGKLLSSDQALEAVVGDTLGAEVFDEPLNQSMKLLNNSVELGVVGVCLDPLNNGNVTYVSLSVLQNATGVPQTNIVMVRIDPSANRTETLDKIRVIVSAVNPDFEVFELDEILDKSVNFIGYIWSAVMFLPLFSLVAASLCLIGYVTLAISEQRQEFGALRALGAKSKTVVNIIATQTLLVLLSSCAVGISFGIMTTLMILIPEPVVTSLTVIEISGWLLAALAAMFFLGLYPAIRFARKPILENMA
ncbi:MAG TPA: ABC transporter permease [Candidatus Bathyarchaeia archaeon]|nr:ABC transporter permease [Candidatus Bathyarchaeia archaeon]